MFLGADTVCLLPDFIENNRTRRELELSFGNTSDDVDEFKRFIIKAFKPLLDYLEALLRSPIDESMHGVLSKVNFENVTQAWNSILQRRDRDPKGTLTAARSLLETVCKAILDEEKQPYANEDLPKLYGKVASVLNLAPSKHDEEIFKKILGGCTTVVEGLGTLRNRLGDAHGRGNRLAAKPAPRHAALSANLAGSMAMFLIETWQSRKSQGKTAKR